MPRTFSPKIIKAKLDLQYGRCANNRFYKGIGFRLIRVSGGQVITFSVVENLLYYTK